MENPQEEPKYITVKEPCSLCDGTGETTFSGTYTTQRKCDLCNGEKYWNKKILVDQPKQETLKEAAINNYPEGDVWTIEQALIRRLAFMNGAKWQAERMYSEKAMIEFAKLHVKAALKQAAHESQCYNKAKFPGDENWTVDIDSILNSYPLDKIK